MNLLILNTIGEVFSDEAKNIINELGDVHYMSVSQEELMDKICGYDAAIVGIGLNFDRPVLNKAERLKVLATATTGLDHIDMEFAQTKGIKVLSLRHEEEFLQSLTGTSELVMGLLISIWRLLPHAHESVKNGEWDRERFRGKNIRGKTFGIVGMGRLGRMTAKYGAAMGMKILYTDPNVEGDFGNCYEKVSLHDLLKRSDAVSLHVHLSPETENMINRSTLAIIKPEAVIINTSRGRIVDEDALLDALLEKKIGGYAADVLRDELRFKGKTFGNNPLVEYSKENQNVIIVPHIGGMTHESRKLTDVFIANKLKSFFGKS